MQSGRIDILAESVHSSFRVSQRCQLQSSQSISHLRFVEFQTLSTEKTSISLRCALQVRCSSSTLKPSRPQHLCLNIRSLRSIIIFIYSVGIISAIHLHTCRQHRVQSFHDCRCSLHCDIPPFTTRLQIFRATTVRLSST